MNAYQEHIRSIRFGGSPKAAEVDNIEAQWAKDIPAYRRLRHSGLQPKSVDGAARLEAQAETQIEVEHNIILTPSERKEYKTAMDVMDNA